MIVSPTSFVVAEAVILLARPNPIWASTFAEESHISLLQIVSNTTIPFLVDSINRVFFFVQCFKIYNMTYMKHKTILEINLTGVCPIDILIILGDFLCVSPVAVKKLRKSEII